MDAKLASAIMSIGGVRRGGFEIGTGFSIAEKRGSEVNDIILSKKGGKTRYKTNNAGGILGGITNGNIIVLRFALKPTVHFRKKNKNP